MFTECRACSSTPAHRIAAGCCFTPAAASNATRDIFFFLRNPFASGDKRLHLLAWRFEIGETPSAISGLLALMSSRHCKSSRSATNESIFH